MCHGLPHYRLGIVSTEMPVLVLSSFHKNASGVGAFVSRTDGGKKRSSTSHSQTGVSPEYMRAMVGHSRHFQGIPGLQGVLVDPRHRCFLSPLGVRLGPSLAARPWSGNHHHQGAPVCLAPPGDPFDLLPPVHPGRHGSFKNTLRRKILHLAAREANVHAVRLPD